MVISSLGKRLSCRQVKKRKREESSKEGKAKRWRFGELYFSAEKHCEPQQINCKKTHCVFFVLAGSRVISGIMYIMAVIIGGKIPSGLISPVRPFGTYLPVYYRRSIHYPWW